MKESQATRDSQTTKESLHQGDPGYERATSRRFRLRGMMRERHTKDRPAGRDDEGHGREPDSDTGTADVQGRATSKRSRR